MMRSTLFFITYGALIVLKSIYWVYLWQLKEYRIDRMRDFLGTESGKKKIWKNLFGLTDSLFLCIAIFAFFSPLSPLLFIAWISIAWTQIVYYIAIRSQFRPHFTLKTLLIVFINLSILSSFGYYAYSTEQAIPLVYSGPIITIPMITGCVLLLAPISKFFKKLIIAAAAEKLRRMPQPPIIIGITGSYGKSTTKEYLRVLLSQKYRVLATPAHVNVDIGVARALLNNLKNDTEVCVVEMGAYKKGEIKNICDLVRPSIAVLTAVADQHLSLFGSVEAIQEAKGELIQAIPHAGLCVVNADSPAAIETVKRFSAAPAYTYSTTQEANMTMSGIDVSPDRVRARYHGKYINMDINAPMHGKHLLSNLLAAIIVAEHLGLSIEEINAGIREISTLSGTMRVFINSSGSVIIDDHYNSNPDGFVAAIDYMTCYEGMRKVVITPGMLELGAHSTEQHQRIGAHIAAHADLCIITKNDFAQDIIEGLHRNGKPIEYIVCTTPEQAIDALQRCAEKDCILLEGRSHSRIIEALTK